jgi:hypothetical protein
VPVLLFSGLAFIFWALQNRADLRALQAAVAGAARRSGVWTAVSGTAVATEPLLPEGLGDLLAYRFSSYDRVRRVGPGPDTGDKADQSWVLRYDGFYLAPTGIDTGGETVRLFGFPDLLHTEKRNLDAPVLDHAKGRAELLPETTPDYIAREKLLGQDRDRIDACFRYGEEDSEGRGRFDCWVLRPGEAVTVFGLYNDGRLHRDPKRPRGLPVIMGTAQEALTDLGETSKGLSWIGGVLLAAAAGAAVWSLI